MSPILWLLGAAFLVLWLFISGLPGWLVSQIPEGARRLIGHALSSALAALILVVVAAIWLLSWLPISIGGQ
ncbi:hypothetical protein AWH62_00935 [Maricaulis sp. W15]|uniref:hypothetical protein n=1 Tax=Maricaulis sp. W15 TaxID=1772333 RepID=UPI000948C56C|nr:hypothetical protein [Maricaulis sp. W15]OLF81271.1 hypothetical protein AWH62_00935 [Maricaulis sp. W15]